MPSKEVVECNNGPACKEDHHGWDCPLSDPQGDILRVLMGPSKNPILEETRKKMIKRWFPNV